MAFEGHAESVMAIDVRVVVCQGQLFEGALAGGQAAGRACSFLTERWNGRLLSCSGDLLLLFSLLEVTAEWCFL